MKKLLTLILVLLVIISPTAYSQITAAVSVDESNNLVYPVDGQISINNTNAIFRLTGSNSVLSVTNAITNGVIRSDDVIVRDYLEVTNYILSRGTLTNIGNTTIGGTLTVTNTSLLIGNTTVGGTLTVTNAGTFNTNVNISGNLTNIGNAVIGGTLTVTNTATFNTNVNVSGNLTNAGNVTINTATTITSQTNHAVRKDYVDNFPILLTYDATGVVNTETVAISNFLTTIAPPTDYPTGKTARVLSISNQYTITVVTNTGSFLTNVTGGITQGTGSFLTAASMTLSLTTNTFTVRFTNSPGAIVPTNTVNATTFSSIDVTSYTPLSTTPGTALTSATLNLTNSPANAITNLTVSFSNTTTRKLFTWVDTGTTWSNSAIITNTGLQ